MLWCAQGNRVFDEEPFAVLSGKRVARTCALIECNGLGIVLIMNA